MNRSRLSLDNRAAERLRAGLRSICAEPGTHARFLNTVSLLEHIGSRKIMLSRGMSADGALLKHLAEESRHAFFFKRAAEKLANCALPYDSASTLAGAAARLYMARLDARVSHGLQPQPLPYLYMSVVIEERAIWAYRIYQSVLAEQSVGISLSGLLAEEDHHLAAMTSEIRRADPVCDQRMARFRSFEHAEFGRFWAAVETALHQPAREAAE